MNSHSDHQTAAAAAAHAASAVAYTTPLDSQEVQTALDEAESDDELDTPGPRFTTTAKLQSSRVAACALEYSSTCGMQRQLRYVSCLVHKKDTSQNNASVKPSATRARSAQRQNGPTVEVDPSEGSDPSAKGTDPNLGVVDSASRTIVSLCFAPTTGVYSVHPVPTPPSSIPV